jgi:hypothetical protein
VVTGTGLSPNIWTTSKTFDWNVLGDGLPIFPFMAWRLEDWLNAEDAGNNNFKVRWWFDKAQPFLPSTSNATDNFRLDPKLVISTDSAVTSGFMTFTFSYSAQPAQLTADYSTIGDNWIGYVGPTSFSTNSIVLSFDVPLGTGNWKSTTTDSAPRGVWNPGVISYGDVRSYQRSIEQSVNPFSLSKVTTTWGERYGREISCPLVCASQVYGFRRRNELFEGNERRRRSSGNLFESFSRSLDTDRLYYIWTQVGDASATDTATYKADFRGRTAKVLDQALLSSDSEGWDFQDDSQRFYTFGVEFSEPLPQTLPDSLTVGN